MSQFFHEIAAMRKLFKGLVFFLIGLALAIYVVTLTPYAYLIKGATSTYLQGEVSASIDDKTFFETDLIRSEKEGIPWPEDFKRGWQPSSFLDSILKESQTVAFAVFQNDTLLYEEYAEGYGRESRTNSFSMAKTITAMIVEIAIENGNIKGWDQPVIDFLPELKGSFAHELTLDHLSKMRAGLDWNEHYTNALGITAKAYYSADVHSVMMNEVEVVDEPGVTYEYQSGATQLLGECVEVATGRSIAELTSSWLWTPARASDDAEWSTDDQHQALCYCCFNSNALDFARLGHILLHRGYWRNHLYMDSTASLDFFNPISTEFYGRSIWLGEANGHRYSYFRGKNGQFIIMIPDANMVIVRLGHTKGEMMEGKNIPVIVNEAVKEYADK